MRGGPASAETLPLLHALCKHFRLPTSCQLTLFKLTLPQTSRSVVTWCHSVCYRILFYGLARALARQPVHQKPSLSSSQTPSSSRLMSAILELLFGCSPVRNDSALAQVTCSLAWIAPHSREVRGVPSHPQSHTTEPNAEQSRHSACSDCPGGSPRLINALMLARVVSVPSSSSSTPCRLRLLRPLPLLRRTVFLLLEADVRRPRQLVCSRLAALTSSRRLIRRQRSGPSLQRAACRLGICSSLRSLMST